MAENNAQFDFMESYVQNLLDASGFADLPQETRNQFLPQIRAEADRRLGLAVLPLLDEKAANNLKTLVEKENFTQEELQDFWTNNVPNFMAVAESTLRSFANEFKNTLKNVQSK